MAIERSGIAITAIEATRKDHAPEKDGRCYAAVSEGVESTLPTGPTLKFQNSAVAKFLQDVALTQKQGWPFLCLRMGREREGATQSKKFRGVFAKKITVPERGAKCKS